MEIKCTRTFLYKSALKWSEQRKIHCLTIHTRVDQDTEPWRARIQPCHDNRAFRTFLIIIIIVTHRPVPTRTPPTIFWLSVDIYRLWTETWREGQGTETINVRCGLVQSQIKSWLINKHVFYLDRIQTHTRNSEPLLTSPRMSVNRIMEKLLAQFSMKFDLSTVGKCDMILRQKWNQLLYNLKLYLHLQLMLKEVLEKQAYKFSRK